jgi:divalent metal cation (Fe/Co/Zn/Cd) transporter
MDRILTGIGVLLFIVGLVTGYASGMGLLHNVSVSVTPNWLIEAVIAIAFMVVGVLMVILGIKKF